MHHSRSFFSRDEWKCKAGRQVEYKKKKKNKKNVDNVKHFACAYNVCVYI